MSGVVGVKTFRKAPRPVADARNRARTLAFGRWSSLPGQRVYRTTAADTGPALAEDVEPHPSGHVPERVGSRSGSRGGCGRQVPSLACRRSMQFAILYF